MFPGWVTARNSARIAPIEFAGFLGSKVGLGDVNLTTISFTTNSVVVSANQLCCRSTSSWWRRRKSAPRIGVVVSQRQKNSERCSAGPG